MKRCPECEFLYEDEQERCDMDGTSLRTTATLPPLPLPPPILPPPKSIWGGMTIPLLVLVLLGTVLVILYRATPSTYSSSSDLRRKEAVNQNSKSPSPQASPESDASPDNSPEAAEPSPETQPKATRSNDSLPSENEPGAMPVNHVPIEPASEVVSPPRTTSASTGATLPASEKTQGVTFAISAQPKLPPATPAPQPSTQDQQKDSKFKSLFKKAGRIIKKAF